MPTPNDANGQNRMIWIVLAALGAVLAVVGWYRWMM
jgi:hypothetical protein